MSSPTRTPIVIAMSLLAMMASTSTVALAQAGSALGDKEGIFIDGKTLTVTLGRSKDDIIPQLKTLKPRPLGPGAIVFRSGDKLYIIEGLRIGGAQAMYDPAIERQRSYGGLSDAEIERHRSYGGFYADLTPAEIERQRSYGGFYADLTPAEIERQRSYGGFYADLTPAEIERQRSYGGFYADLTPAEIERQRSYGGVYADLTPAEIERQRSYGGFFDSAAESRRQAHRGHYDPDYANYRLKRVFGSVWANDKN